MRYVFRFCFALALSLMLPVGCGEEPECYEDTDCDDNNECTEDTCTEGTCDSAPVLDGKLCDDQDGNECTEGTCTEGTCDSAPVLDGKLCDDQDGNECTEGTCTEGTCGSAPVLDGTPCGNDAGTCQQGRCMGTFACTEQGIRDAIATGGGPHTFSCDGLQTVVTQGEIGIHNNVILDGEGNLTINAGSTHRVLHVLQGVTATFAGMTISGGHALDHNGGGIAVEEEASLTLDDCTVSHNTAELPSGSDLYRGYGGGIYNEGTLTLTNSTVSDNTAIGREICFIICGLHGGQGGGIDNEGGTVILTNSTVSNNRAERGGGVSIRWDPDNEKSGTLRLNSSAVSGNTAGETYGTGGIYIEEEGTVTLTNSTVSGNTRGGIYNYGGTLTLTHSTVSGNTASDGGGIANYWGTLTLTNSTVSGNTAEAYGGGIYNYGGTLTLTNSTVSENTATYVGGGIYNYEGTMLMLTNTLVDNDCGGGTALSGGGNLESPGNTCGFDQPTDQPGVTAEQLNLGPLADNGGPTQTHALGAGSVAIDAIPAEDCVDADGESLMTDQRGESRPETGGTMCDVGAFEVQP